jgi:hypothetical protein
MSGLRGWEATERMLESGGFESRQRVLLPERAVEPSGNGARRLGATYWQAVAGVTRGVVRATWGDRGGRLRLLGGATLLRFGSPQLHHTEGVVSCGYPIEGGLLALRPGGSVTLAQRRDGDEHELSVTVAEYVPRLAARARAPRWTGALYAKGLSPFHLAVSRRYFDLLTRGHVA